MSASPGAAADTRAIADVLGVYFDGLYQGDSAVLARAFHPSARLYSMAEGDVREMPRAEWLKAVDGRPAPSASNAPRTDRIVAIHVTDGIVASAVVECSIHPNYYVDHLTLLRTPEHGWQIVAKAFRTILKDGP